MRQSANIRTKEPCNTRIRDDIQEEDNLVSKLGKFEDADGDYIRIVKKTTLNPDAKQFAPTIQDSVSKLIPEDVDITQQP